MARILDLLSFKYGDIKIMELKYIGRTRNGLKNNHSYVVKIFPPATRKYVYDIHFIYDITDQEEIDLIMNYASMISIKHNFKFDKLELED